LKAANTTSLPLVTALAGFTAQPAHQGNTASSLITSCNSLNTHNKIR
jgi:hypothetical protein